mgnify:CR=1 FL=1
MKAESMWNYELAFNQRLFDNRLSYGFNLFYINGKNMITTASIDHRMMNVNTGKIKNAGLEMQMAYSISKTWSADANYSYLHMEHPVSNRHRKTSYMPACPFQKRNGYCPPAYNIYKVFIRT